MEQTRERSTSDMPRALVVIAAVLLCARLIETGVSLAQTSTRQAPRESVQWQEMVPLNSAAALSRQEFVPPPVLDVSPDSMREIEKVLSASRAQNKFVLYEFYAPWSDPCKKMESTSLSNAQVDKLIDEHFMPVRVTDRLKELGKNPRLVTDLQKKFRIFAFPTLVIVDSEGETAATLVGNCSSLTTYRFLSRALHTLDLKSRATKIRSISWNEHIQNCSSRSHF
ncbi:thioredoxin family protein [Candidatus Obscuribacterales bacterium]|nr:thioredoxin family protein [Candidatus Obscuribacterales bacterium]